MITPSEFTKIARRKRWFGLSRDNNITFRSGQPIKDIGFKFHMNDIASAIGRANYPHIKDLIKRNRSNANMYYDLLSDVDEVQLLENEDGFDSSYWLFTLLVKNRESLSKYLLSKGIESNPVHVRNDIHRPLLKYKTDLPTLNKIENKILCIPVGWWVTKNEIKRIVKTIKEFYDERKMKSTTCK